MSEAYDDMLGAIMFLSLLIGALLVIFSVMLVHLLG